MNKIINNAPANILDVETLKLDTGHPDHQFEKENYLLFLLKRLIFQRILENSKSETNTDW